MDNKAPDAFRTISEVADELDLPQHVLRFWESRFHEIRPMKRGGGRRYYRPDDIDLLRGIRHLLYGEGYTIRGVQRILREQGNKFVQVVWQEGAPQPPHVAEYEPEEEDIEAAERVEVADDPGLGGRLSALIGRDLGERQQAEDRREPPMQSAPMPHIDAQDRAIHQVTEPVAPPPSQQPAPPPQVASPSGLSRDQRLGLQAALHELTECRKLLDAALAR